MNMRSLKSASELFVAGMLCLSLSASAAKVEAQTLTRGPYLQNGSTSAVSIRWKTSSNTDSLVRYGTSPSSLTQSVSNATGKTTHELRLTGLSPDTKYYYSVGNAASTLASGTSYFFVTAPTGQKPTRIWVIGDAGTNSAGQTQVRDAYYSFAGTRPTDLWLMLGDNAYNSGTDSEYQSAVFNIYGSLLRNSVVWSTLGNHDGYSASSSSQTGPYYDIFTLPRSGEAGGVASGTEAYYSFDYGNIHFVCLNSYDVSRATSSAMLTWLTSDLSSNTKDWLVAFFHHPPYSKGSHNSDTETELVEMRQNALPILESHGVDLVLSGHSHAYERSKLLDGHYGSSGSLTSAMIKNGGSGRVDGTGAYAKVGTGPVAREGAVYAVAGASGQADGGSLNHPAMYVSLNVLGSMVIDVNGNQLDAQYIDNTGTRRDYFTLTKGGIANVPPTAAIAAPASGATYTAPASIAIDATATDSDGSVTRVDFYAGSTLLGTDTTSPYSFTWNGVTAGSYSLTVRSTDNAGATRTSTAVPVTVTTPGGGTPVTVSFRNGSAGYTAMVDASLRSDATTTNYGTATSLLADGSPDYAALLRWDLSSIPSNKTVTKVQLTVNVFDKSTGSYELYALKRFFSESEATWQRASATVNWQTAGANGANDRETSVLGTVNGSATGNLTVTLNAAGIAKVQSWVANPSTNNGFVLLDYAVSDGLDLRSSEYGTVAERPQLTITYE